MLRIVDLDEHHFMTISKKHSVFRNYFHRAQKNEMFDEKNRCKFENARKILRKYTLNIIHIVVITIFNNDDANLYENFQFELIIMNEIIRVLKFDM